MVGKKLVTISIVSVVAIALALVLFIQVGINYTVIINEHIGVTDRIGGNVFVYKNDELVFNEHNNMTNIGDDSINDKLFNSSWAGSTWNYIAIGSGDGSATNKTRTALVTETDRQLGVFAKPADAQWELNYTFTFASSVTIKEAGILNAAAVGTMSFYIWTLNVGVTTSDTLKICWRGTTSGY